MLSYSFVYLNGSESTLRLSCSIAKLRASSELQAISWRSWNAEGAIQSTAQCSIPLFSFSFSFPVTASPRRNNGTAPRPRLTSANASQLISFPPRVLYLKEWYKNTCRGTWTDLGLPTKKGCYFLAIPNFSKSLIHRQYSTLGLTVKLFSGF